VLTHGDYPENWALDAHDVEELFAEFALENESSGGLAAGRADPDLNAEDDAEPETRREP
jgi:hypothetical protein